MLLFDSRDPGCAWRVVQRRSDDNRLDDPGVDGFKIDEELDQMISISELSAGLGRTKLRAMVVLMYPLQARA